MIISHLAQFLKARLSNTKATPNLTWPQLITKMWHQRGLSNPKSQSTFNPKFKLKEKVDDHF
jgi:hypothetical protein